MSKGSGVVLHAGAAADQRGAVAFVGAPGEGKSTLTGGFCVAGWRLVADDCLLLRQETGTLLAVPSYPGLRLWPDAATALFARHPTVVRVKPDTDNRRVGAVTSSVAFCADPVPLPAGVRASAGRGCK